MLGRVPYLLKVIWAISAMSEPTGPHGSLLVAARVSMRRHSAMSSALTIADLHFNGRVALRDILQRPSQPIARRIGCVYRAPTFTLLTTFDMAIGDVRLQICVRRWSGRL